MSGSRRFRNAAAMRDRFPTLGEPRKKSHPGRYVLLMLFAGAVASGLTQTRFFESSEAAAASLAEEVRAGDLVLIKGSRGVETDKVISRLRQRFALVGEEEQ